MGILYRILHLYNSFDKTQREGNRMLSLSKINQLTMVNDTDAIPIVNSSDEKFLKVRLSSITVPEKIKVKILMHPGRIELYLSIKEYDPASADRYLKIVYLQRLGIITEEENGSIFAKKTRTTDRNS